MYTKEQIAAQLTKLAELQKQIKEIQETDKALRTELMEMLEQTQTRKFEGVEGHTVTVSHGTTMLFMHLDPETSTRKEMIEALKEARDDGSTDILLNVSNADMRAELEHLQMIHEPVIETVVDVCEGLTLTQNSKTQTFAIKVDDETIVTPTKSKGGHVTRGELKDVDGFLSGLDKDTAQRIMQNAKQYENYGMTYQIFDCDVHTHPVLHEYQAHTIQLGKCTSEAQYRALDRKISKRFKVLISTFA